jgi:hypothetical protein
VHNGVSTLMFQIERQSADTLTTMETRESRVLLETPRYRVVGTLRLPRDGYRSRMTDYLNSNDRDFIALTDVEVRSLDDPSQGFSRPFLAISRQHIVLATEDAPA